MPGGPAADWVTGRQGVIAPIAAGLDFGLGFGTTNREKGHHQGIERSSGRVADRVNGSQAPGDTLVKSTADVWALPSPSKKWTPDTVIRDMGKTASSEVVRS